MNDILKEHVKACTICTDYPKAPCDAYYDIAEAEAVKITVKLLSRDKSADFIAGIEAGLRMYFATQLFKRMPPTCKRLMHCTPASRPQDGCMYCGYVGPTT